MDSSNPNSPVSTKPGQLQSSSATAVVRQVCDPRFFATLECELLERCRFKTQTEARSAVFAFIEGFYNPRRRHSSIGYLSPIDYEHRHHAATVDRDTHQPAAVLAAVKDKPFGRPQEAAVLDRHCARQPRQCAGRDGRMAPPGAEPQNATKPEDNMT